MKWLLHIIINSIALMVVAGYFESIYLEGLGAAIIASLVLSVLNIFVKPLLVLITLPVTFLSLGLFLFVINAVTLMITDGIMGKAFQIEGFGMAILAAVIISIVNLVLQKFIVQPLEKKRS